MIVDINAFSHNEPFERIETDRTRTQSGLRVGLAVARQRADLIGGEVSLERAIGSGGTFTVTPGIAD